MTPVDVFVSVLEESIRPYKLFPNKMQDERFRIRFFFLQFYNVLFLL